MQHLRILAISGSLRKASYNTALLEALRMCSPSHIDIIIYKNIGALPLFNPDLENDQSPALVRELKMELERAQGLIIASPEYAHGISGVLKNALDWLVSGEEFVGLPVALFNASPRATHAQAALREVIGTMSARIVEPASIAMALLGTNLTAVDIAADADLREVLIAAVENFYSAITAESM